MNVDPQTGWLDEARPVISPNYDERPPHTPVDMLVVHGISLPPGEFNTPWVEALFTNTLDYGAHGVFAPLLGLKVSCHLLIGRKGQLTQFVPFNKRAWHAGESAWLGRTRCNDFSIGIELEGCDDRPYDGRQYFRLAQVATLLMRVYPQMTPERILGHSDIAPGRKSDPGPAFDWTRFRALLKLQLRPIEESVIT